MPEMTADEYRSFVASDTRTGKLATIRWDGRTRAVPVWFVLDGDDLLFVTSRTSAKGKAILRGGRISLCVDDEKPPYAFALIEGTTTTTEDAGDLLYWSTRVAARYVVKERGEAFGRRDAVEGEMLARLTPAKVVAEKNVAGE